MQVVDHAVAKSGLTGANAKCVSDALTSSIVLGLLSGSGSSDATAYTSNEIKYNYLTAVQRAEVERLLRCQTYRTECTPEEFENRRAIDEEFHRISLEQSQELDRVCNKGPSEACNALLKEAREFENWRYYIPYSRTVLDLTKSYSTIEASGFLGIVNLTYHNILVDVYSRGLSGEEANREIVATIIRYNAKFKIVNGVLTTATGLVLCPVSSGAGCIVAIAAVTALGANRIEQGINELITDKEQLSFLAAGIVKAGASEATANDLVNKMETGAAIATSVYGGYALIREVGANGKVLAIAKVGDEYLAKYGAGLTNIEGRVLKATLPDGYREARSLSAAVTQDDLPLELEG